MGKIKDGIATAITSLTSAGCGVVVGGRGVVAILVHLNDIAVGGGAALAALAPNMLLAAGAAVVGTALIGYAVRNAVSSVKKSMEISKLKKENADLDRTNRDLDRENRSLENEINYTKNFLPTHNHSQPVPKSPTGPSIDKKNVDDHDLDH